MFRLRLGCVLVALGLLCACGGGGGGNDGSVTTGGDPIDPGVVAASEGSLDVPALLPVNVTYAGFTGFAPSYYQFTTNSAGAYVLGVRGASEDMTWSLYASPDFSNFVQFCDEIDGPGDEVCTVFLDPATDYYLLVSDWDMSFSNTINIDILIAEINGEGDPANPVPLQLAQTHAGTVDYQSSSYYQFAPDASGGHTIRLDGFVPAYSDPNLSLIVTDDLVPATTLKTCSISADPICVVNGLIAGETYYLQVEEQGLSQFSYDLVIDAGLSEGALGAPLSLPLGDVHAGGVDAYGASYYTFTTAGSGSYEVAISSPTDLYLYSDAAFSNQIAHTYCDTGSCLFPALDSSSSYYLMADGATADATYQISVATGQSEGSVNDPIPLSIDVTRHANIDANGTSYYTFMPTADAELHVVFTGANTGVEWRLYDDQGSYQEMCVNYNNPTLPEFSCVTNPLTTGATYYLNVKTISATDLSFDLRLSSVGYSEGSIAQPVVLSLATPHSGGVNGSETSMGHSYYKFRTTDPGEYNVIFEGDGFSATVYDAADYNVMSDLVNCSESTGLVECQVKNLARDTDYYISTRNYDKQDAKYTVEVTGPALPDGCSGSGTCYDFEDGLVPDLFVDGGYMGDPWFIAAGSDATGTGSYSLRAGVTAKSRTSCISFSVASATSISFNVKTDSEVGNDRLRLYIDGVADYRTWSGDTGWQRVTATWYSPETKSFEWCYEKNGSVDVGSDTVWLDDIEVQ